jgi:hypothetical protein
MAATEIQQGVAKIFAMDGATQVVLTGAATITYDSADLDQAFDSDALKGQNGEVETLVASNENFTCTVNFAPNGATRAAAITSCANAQPAKITKVVLSNFSVAAYNGNWNSMGYSIKMSSNASQPVMMTLKLQAWITNRTSLTAGVIVG